MHLPEKLNRFIIVYAVLAAFAMSVVFTISGLAALHRHYQGMQKAALFVALKARVGGVEQFLSRANDVSMQVTSRTKIRDSLEDYNRGRITLARLEQFTIPKLHDALNISEDVVGISRFDANGHLVVQVGLSIPGTSFSVPADINSKVVFLNPFALAGNNYLPIFTPIINRKSERVGTDMVLFNTKRLQEIITDQTGLGKSAETILAVAVKGNIRPLFSRRQMAGTSEILPKQGRLGSALSQSITGKEGLLRPIGKEHNFIIFAPIPASEWGLAVKVAAVDILAPEKHAAFILVFLAAIITASGIIFMFLLLRPLIGALRKEMAERLTREKKLLQFRDLLDCSTDAVFIASPKNGRFLDMNQTASDLLGYTRQELLGMNVADVDLGIPDTTAWAEFAAQTTHKKKLLFTTELKRKDRTTVVVEINSRYVPGTVDTIVAAVRDISERKKAEQELKKYRDHLEELIKERTASLEERNRELERMNKIFVNRELRMAELKERIRDLEEKVKNKGGQP